MSLLWKLSLVWKLSLLYKLTLFNVTAVEIELAELIEPAVKIKRITGEWLNFHSRLNFHCRLFSPAVTLKSAILFLFYLKNNSCLGKKICIFV